MSNILIIDDHEKNRYLVRTILTAAGDEVLEAANGVEGLEMARRTRPDLIISDILMPQMDGFTLCRECKRDEKLRDIPFVFYTATYTDPRDKALAMQLGAIRFIVKPIENEAFIAILRQVLQEHAAGRFAEPASLLEEQTPFYRLYNEALVRKLEDKLLDVDRSNRSLAESEDHFRMLAENMSDTVWLMDMNLRTTYISPSVTRLRGYTLDELNEIPLEKHMPPDSLQRANQLLTEVLSQENTIPHDLPISRSIELEFFKKDGSKYWSENTYTLIRDQEGAPVAILGTGRDITERKQVEDDRETIIEFLRLANSSTSTVELIHMVTGFFQDKSGCQAVGIRLKDGDDYPYYETHGFTKEFVQMENSLCSRTSKGEIVRGSDGNPILECMCGNVICGRFDPAKPFFTPRGSFWTNSTTQLLASTTEADRQARTRNRCNGEGYESVALLPLCFGNERMGLLQFNDPRQDLFTLERIILWESLADLLAIALARSRAKDELHRSENFLHNIIEHSPHAMWISDSKGTLIRLNQACRDLLHIRDEEVIGKYNLLQDNIVAEQGFLPLVKRVYENGETTNFIIRYDSSQLKDIKVSQTAFVILDVTITPIVDANGRVTNAIIQHVDITEQKQAEEALHALLRRHEALLAAVPEIIMEVDQQKVYTWANQAGLEFFGAEAIGKEAAFYFEGQQDTYQTVQPVFNGDGRTLYVESWQRRQDGHKRLLAWWCRSLMDEDGNVYGALSSARDITDHRLAEEEIRRLNSELENRIEERTRELREAQEKLVLQERLAVMGQLAGGVGHELRNPLGVINNAVYYLRLIQPEADEKTKEYFGIIENETRSAEKIINDLLDYSRIKSVDREFMDVSELFQHVLERYPAPENVIVSVRITARLPPVYADPRQMLQVLGNLAVNAYEAMPDGGNLILSAKKKGENIAISVQDHGVGIPQGNMNKLFEPLFTTKMHGIGLGLSVCKKLVEANDGRIEVGSVEGKGATFTVYIPIDSEKK
jgi:PAS domain S-box-containing protein